MALDLRQISFPLNILRTNRQNFTKFYKCIPVDKIYVGIVTQHFLHICTRVMALDLPQNSVSAQYLEKKIVISSPNFIYAFILTRSTLGLLHIIFRTFVPEL